MEQRSKHAPSAVSLRRPRRSAGGGLGDQPEANWAISRRVMPGASRAGPGLWTVKLTLSAGEPEAGLREVALGEGQHLRGGDREDERVAAVVAEHAIPHLEVPIAVILL